MAHQPIPTGWHDPDYVSAQLGISKQALYKKLHQIGWLIWDKKNGITNGNHNLPRREVVQAGYMQNFECTFGSGPNKIIDRSYRIPIWSEKGFLIVKNIIKDGAEPPALKKPVAAVEQKTEKIPDKKELQNDPQTQRSRQHALQQLKQIGL